MRNEEMTDFDLKIRSLLEDAEEPVPSRLWSSVSRRLGATAAPVVSPVWKWAGAALAAAAVLGAAFLLVGTSDKEEAVVGIDAVAQAEILPDNIKEESVPELVGETFEESAVASRPATAVSGKKEVSAGLAAKPAAAPSEVSAPETAAPVSVKGNIGSEEKTAETATETEKKNFNKKEKEPWTDPFAGIALEEKKAQRRPAELFAQGTLSGNDNGGANVLQSRYGLKKAAGAPGIQEKSVSTYDIPVTFGLGVRFRLSDNLSVGTGLEWSLLSRSFDGIYTKALADGTLSNTPVTRIDHNLQYVGIPVNVYYDILLGKTVNFYVWGGGDAQKCISNKYLVSYSSDTFSKSVSGLQFSAGAGFGVEFALTKSLGVYLDPSARYWFGGDQPKSIRTEKPLTIGFEAGLRFKL